ncbi:MAG TPA: hypothetical protein VIZ17_13530 [Acetobacteraceae bacterium]
MARQADQTDGQDCQQARFRRNKLHELTNGDRSTPIVALGWNPERF